MTEDPGDVPEAVVRRALEEGLDRIRSHIRSKLADPNHADEVLQIFCARALERAADLKDGAAARSWLSRVLATTIADYCRSLARRRARETPADEGHLSSLAAEIEADRVACACLEALLDGLSDTDAALIRGIDIEDHDRESVAAALGLNLNALTVRLHRARARLRTLVLRLCAACVAHGFDDCGCPPSGAQKAEN
ncbi:MAG: sigma factor [Hyphomonadaceae bacterium]|jgi:RNA polymerase sigma-70 factor (ECF subfamily)